ncbi:MAG TPA: hypothetical protein VF813_10290 [Anaerolineaceae bacterium]
MEIDGNGAGVAHPRSGFDTDAQGVLAVTRQLPVGTVQVVVRAVQERVLLGAHHGAPAVEDGHVDVQAVHQVQVGPVVNADGDAGVILARIIPDRAAHLGVAQPAGKINFKGDEEVASYFMAAEIFSQQGKMKQTVKLFLAF